MYNDSIEVEKVASHMSMKPVLHECSNWPCVNSRRGSGKAHTHKNQASQSSAACTHMGSVLRCGVPLGLVSVSALGWTFLYFVPSLSKNDPLMRLSPD